MRLLRDDPCELCHGFGYWFLDVVVGEGRIAHERRPCPKLHIPKWVAESGVTSAEVVENIKRAMP